MYMKCWDLLITSMYALAIECSVLRPIDQSEQLGWVSQLSLSQTFKVQSIPPCNLDCCRSVVLATVVLATVVLLSIIAVAVTVKETADVAIPSCTPVGHNAAAGLLLTLIVRSVTEHVTHMVLSNPAEYSPGVMLRRGVRQGRVFTSILGFVLPLPNVVPPLYKVGLQAIYDGADNRHGYVRPAHARTLGPVDYVVFSTGRRHIV